MATRINKNMIRFSLLCMIDKCAQIRNELGALGMSTRDVEKKIEQLRKELKNI